MNESDQSSNLEYIRPQEFLCGRNILMALALNLFAGLATGIGSLVAYLIPKPDLRYLSLSLFYPERVSRARDRAMPSLKPE